MLHHEARVLARAVGREIGIRHVGAHALVLGKLPDARVDEAALLKGVANELLAFLFAVDHVRNEADAVLEAERIGAVLILHGRVEERLLVPGIAAQLERRNGLDVDGGEVSRHRHRFELPVEADELGPKVLLPGGENAHNLIGGVHLDEEIQSLVLEHHDAVHLVGNRDRTADLVGDDALGKGRKSKSKREGRCGAPEEKTFLHRKYFQAS